MDVFGKHGPALQDLLLRLADLARQHDVDSGTQPRRWLHRWRVRIATEIARGCAKQISSANSSTAPVRQIQPVLATPAPATTTTTPPDTSLMDCATTFASVAPADPSLSGVHSTHTNAGVFVANVQPATTPSFAGDSAACVQTAPIPCQLTTTTATHPTLLPDQMA